MKTPRVRKCSLLKGVKVFIMCNYNADLRIPHKILRKTLMVHIGTQQNLTKYIHQFAFI